MAVDIRTTNGRYLDLNIRLPRELVTLEPELRKLVQERVGRSRVEAYLSLSLRSANQYEVDETLVENYVFIATRLRALDIAGELDAATLLQLPGVVKPRHLDPSAPEIYGTAIDVFQEALARLLATRTAEGENLKADLQRRIDTLDSLVEQLAGQAAGIRDYHREKLLQRVRELTAGEVVDENRLAQEVLFYAERADISEELTRLRSHLGRFRKYLEASDHESVGKSLDFLCQEMNREMNTILSKSPLAEICEVGVEGKTEIEKIREQVQNVE